ncbi:MAG: N-acetyltransferase [Deltaproteobacteria bacterium]|mgnify:CR=1 FL=1|nr:N-acetyltransferase [Deltaproteobacteria bacterium]HEN20606.1 N-acetyltransferase [Desulfobacteraceae bacterium]
MHIRKALIGDIKAIHKLLNLYAEQGRLLSRALSELYDHLRDYVVLEDEDKGNLICGVCGLSICWEDLAEIRSLAVLKDMQGKRYGFQLVTECVKEARMIGIKKVFALTYVPEFFGKLGFSEVAKSILPHKIWADCLKCPKFPDCDETAVMLDLQTSGHI